MNIVDNYDFYYPNKTTCFLTLILKDLPWQWYNKNIYSFNSEFLENFVQVPVRLPFFNLE